MIRAHLTIQNRRRANKKTDHAARPFPILLVTGTEGIAVGLSPTSCRTIHRGGRGDQSYLNQEPFELYPDFPTGGPERRPAYNDGRPARGSRCGRA
jgi:topoisomerase-4 subunit A